jgi:hypothetical protein
VRGVLVHGTSVRSRNVASDVNSRIRLAPHAPTIHKDAMRLAPKILTHSQSIHASQFRGVASYPATLAESALLGCITLNGWL